MKRIRKLMSLLAVAAIFALSSRVTVLPVSAADGTTFYAIFNTSLNEWRIQRGKWDEEDKGREAYYLNNGDSKIKDGDLLVIMSNGEKSSTTVLTVDARLSNLTFNRATGTVTAKGIDDCYVLGDSFAAINGDVTNAYVYDQTVCTFNNNIGTLKIITSDGSVTLANMSVGGTVGHVTEGNNKTVWREFYNVAAGKLAYDSKGTLLTEEKYYSKTPSSKPAAATSKPASSSSASVSGDEYVVQKGDTLSKIAKQNGLTLKEIVALNPQIKNINLIRVGQKIKLK